MTNYALTDAVDWPMLVGMLTALKWSMGISSAVVIIMVGALCGVLVYLYQQNRAEDKARWEEMRETYISHKNDETRQCTECHNSTSREFDALWETIEVCCPRSESRPMRRRRKTDQEATNAA